MFAGSPDPPQAPRPGSGSRLTSPRTSSATENPKGDGRRPDRWRSERSFWDDVADRHSTDAAGREEAARSWAWWFDIACARLAPLAGVRALDCGCGDGALARALAARGARVAAFDVSPGKLSSARQASGSALSPGYACSIFEALPFADGTFGAAAGTFVLHHVEIGAAARELARVLAPGSRATFMETWQRNPLLRLARRLRGHLGIARYGTDDERPLLPSDVRIIRAAGFDVRLEYPGFVFFRLIGNNVLRGRLPRLARLLTRLDYLLERVPFAGPFSYYCVLNLTRHP